MVGAVVNRHLEPSKRCVDLIKQFEGFQPKPYLCPANVWTIGYGHTKGVTADTPPISELTAVGMLESDLESFAALVLKLVKSELNQNQFDALCSFVFNVGGKNFERSTLLKKINSGDYPGAAQEFERWVKAGGAVLPGLVARRKAERKLFEEEV